jgi:hypothetical protein
LRLAIVGSRRDKFSEPAALDGIYRFLDGNLKPDTEVILAGCPMTRDSWIRDYLVSHQIKFNEYNPPGPLGINSRNRRVVEESDELWAFWTGETAGSGTLDIVRVAKDSGKAFRLFVVKDGKIEETKTVP